MCEEILSGQQFSRNNVVAILQKIPTVGIEHISVKYCVYDYGKLPKGWRCIMPLKKEICFVEDTWPTDSLTSILDLPEINADCSNLYKIRIDTTKYRYEIDVLSSSVSISGPDMPFSPAELIAAGIRGEFNYKCN